MAALATLAVAALASEREQLARSVRASRTRIVLAADDERRRLERNLHDGAQGRLVALAARLGLAAPRGAARARGRAASSFETAHAELLVAIDELRELVQGIQPAALRQFGLARAVEDVAARSVTPIELVELPRVRLDETTEATAFYLIREAVTNAERYAHASAIRVRAHLSDASLIVEIEDDGVGGAFERNDHGLQGLRDRVEATGGHSSSTASPARGTRIRAEIPRGAAQLLVTVRAPRPGCSRWPGTSSAAFTRRLTSSGLSSSSLVKIALMCFSTARLVSTSDSAIAALLLPWASSASTSCSRRVSDDSGERAPALRAWTSTSTTLGSITDPPATTASIAATSCCGSLTRSLSR